jgi:putative heme-binding domain-containing protein
LAVTADDRRAAAMRAASAWEPENPELLREYFQVASNVAASPGVADAAVEALSRGGAAAAEHLRALAQPRGTENPLDNSYRVRARAISAIASFDPADASKRAGELLTKSNGDPGLLLEGILQRENGAAALNDALAGRTIPKDTAKLALRYLNVSGRDAGPLLQTIRTAAGVGATPKPPMPEEIQQIVARMQKEGDPARGELVFRRADTGCYNCHMIAGAGANVGPDLRAIGASSPPDYIVESVLVPNKSIKENFNSLIVATKKGDVFSGIPVTRDDQQLVLRDATHDRIVIPVGDIRRQKDGGSLMPVGLADTLTEQELLDLCRFLSELGKPGPFAADKQSVVRRWKVLDGDSAANVTGPGADALPWKSAYSLAGGTLPLDSLSGDTVLARAEIDVTSAGRLAYSVNDGAGVAGVYLDDQRLRGQDLSGNTPEMSVGRHRITFVLDRAKRGSTGLELELKDAAGETGHGQIVGGR